VQINTTKSVFDQICFFLAASSTTTTPPDPRHLLGELHHVKKRDNPDTSLSLDELGHYIKNHDNPDTCLLLGELRFLNLRKPVVQTIVHFFSSVAHVWIPGAKTTNWDDCAKKIS
jgi:hypothetical protein